MKFLIELFEGFTMSFPLNFLNVHPRKSNPLSICVIMVFSSDNTNPRDLRNSLTMSFSSSAISLVLVVIMKSYVKFFAMVSFYPKSAFQAV